ncbi:hypothetical protein BDW66DRAFT_166261 [Aspergillus desertorum]
MFAASPETVADINLLAGYLSNPQLQLEELPSSPPVDCIVICASMILHQAETLFQTLQNYPYLTKALVLCGGIGHSTRYIYEAVAQHGRFSPIRNDIQCLPEARVLERILDTFFDRAAITSQGCRILIEDHSSNCGENALFSRRVLDDVGFQKLRSCAVIQDPTMMRRTVASFQKAYEEAGRAEMPLFLSCPVLVPQVESSEGPEGEQRYCQRAAPGVELWPPERFISLVMGEIPRLRDDEDGYGPRGRGFIPHVEIPVEVEAAWARLRAIFDTAR